VKLTTLKPGTARLTFLASKDNKQRQNGTQVED
jgi:hypothetical protein